VKEKCQSLDIFSSAPVPEAVFKNALPAMAAMLMVLVYNLADTFFIGQTHDVLMVAAVSLATPVFLLFMAVGTVFGIGGTSVISRAMGEGRKEYAKKVSSFCMWSCIIVGFLMSLILFLFMNSILKLIGTSEGTREMTRIYLKIVIVSGPFVLIGNCFSNVLRAEGQSAKAMAGMVIGNLLNVILDPIMILGFDWGIAGAAIATVIGNFAGAGYYVYYFLHGDSMLSIRPHDFTVKEKVLSGVLSIGIPASLGTVLMSISSILLDNHMAQYSDMAVAGIGVAIKVAMMTSLVCIGLGQGIQPLLGYCCGAKDRERYLKVFHFSVLFALILSTMMTAICYIFTNDIVNAFVTDKKAFEYGVSFSRILLSTSFLFGIYYVILNALQAVGAAIPSLIINLSRQGLIYIPALLLLETIFGLKGLVWAQPVADVVSVLLAIRIYCLRLKSENIWF